jgi:murein L,D-transpeptidase YafK
MTTFANVHLIIDKAARRLYLMSGDRIERSYSVAIGKNTEVDKEIEGDCATPAGDFYVCAKNPRSKFFLSLCLSYPNGEDAERGLAGGLISQEEHAQILEAIASRKMPPQHTQLGGEIYIHGQAPQGATLTTRGCIAVDNAAMREVYDAAELGTPVRIIG